MSNWLARGLAWTAFAGLLVAVFGVTAYVSFGFFVRSGVTSVPDLLGRPEENIQSELADHGLRFERSFRTDQYDEEVPAGHVIRQVPAAGSLVKRGSAVEVSVSLGPERSSVPDLGGQTVQAAQVSLTGAGLLLGRVVNVVSSTAIAGTIDQQVPAANSSVGPGTPIHLLVANRNRSDTYVMPDLTYRNFETVRHFFERRGFRLGSVKFEPYEGLSSGVVLRQYPLPGHPLGRQDVISLIVSMTG